MPCLSMNAMPVIKRLGCEHYETVWQAMRQFTDQRLAETNDEIWLLEHPPVYTLGQGGKGKHILRANGIPVIRSDRGGQVTYHGPGQIIAYVLLDIRQRNGGLRFLVRQLEEAVIRLLSDYGIKGCGNEKAPGVYVQGAKIAAIGLRLRRGCTYHGVSLNVAMDLSPFLDIDPCGYAGLAVTQMADYGVTADVKEIMQPFALHLQKTLAE